MTALKTLASVALLACVVGCGGEEFPADELATQQQDLMNCVTCEPPETSGVGMRQLMVNGGFETAPYPYDPAKKLGWQFAPRVQHLQSSIYRYDADALCRTGSYCLVIGGEPAPAQNYQGRASQVVALPADADHLAFAFDLYTFAFKRPEGMLNYDVVRVTLEDLEGHELKSVARINPNAWALQGGITGWTHFGPVDLTAWRGQSVRVVVSLLQWYQSKLVWRADNFKLTAYYFD